LVGCPSFCITPNLRLAQPSRFPKDGQIPQTSTSPSQYSCEYSWIFAILQDRNHNQRHYFRCIRDDVISRNLKPQRT